jgi:hypothetical protein
MTTLLMCIPAAFVLVCLLAAFYGSLLETKPENQWTRIQYIWSFLWMIIMASMIISVVWTSASSHHH